MTGNELRLARATLGDLWDMDRPVFASELGRILNLSPTDPGESIRRYEQRRDQPIPGPIALAVEFMLRGMIPPGGLPVKRAVRERPKA